ncbi:helix-turn-helix domain-containing protein [Brevibacillus brevis]|uniref:helix-turn-helix domain-containing protein n=1 Tax=Brevibacillus brevis TaxID=1393 RepID=UPI001E405C9E|nr:helix-turn-helix domain-containing protein [Brevibacillus brevis]
MITLTLGNKLKALREQRGWTQTLAASRLGISSQVVSNYERNYRSPDKEMLSRIAKVYNCSLDWLLGISDDPERIEDNASVVEKKKSTSEFESLFFYELEKLSEEDKQKALEHVRYLRYLTEQENRK